MSVDSGSHKRYMRNQRIELGVDVLICCSEITIDIGCICGWINVVCQCEDEVFMWDVRRVEVKDGSRACSIENEIWGNLYFVLSTSSLNT
jgi:hypothetical protein